MSVSETEKISLPGLNLPSFAPKIRRLDDGIQIFDPCRRKYVQLTPEEWVRQHWINYLSSNLGYPVSRMGVEFGIRYGNLSKRPDISVFDQQGEVETVVECKAPHIALSENTFLQLASYYKVLRPKYAVMTNGLHHVIASIDRGNGALSYLQELPAHA